eukprot:6856541-Ditylum_brightwellii.AAC.1
MDNKPLKKKAHVSMEKKNSASFPTTVMKKSGKPKYISLKKPPSPKKTPVPSAGGRRVCKKLVQNKIMSSPLAKTPSPKKKPATLPVARGKPPPSPVARSDCNKPGLNKKCGKSPNELLVKQMQRDSERMHGNWVQDVKQGRVKSNCPLSLPFGCIMSDVIRFTKMSNIMLKTDVQLVL